MTKIQILVFIAFLESVPTFMEMGIVYDFISIHLLSCFNVSYLVINYFLKPRAKIIGTPNNYCK